MRERKQRRYSPLHIHEGHYCLNDKNNRLLGIQEIQQNFVKQETKCSNASIRKIKGFTVGAKVVSDDKVFMYDLETAPKKMDIQKRMLLE